MDLALKANCILLYRLSEYMTRWLIRPAKLEICMTITNNLMNPREWQ